MGEDTFTSPLIGYLYQSPPSNWADLTSSLCNLLNMIDGHTHVLICGDFNFPNINWSLEAGDHSHTQAFVEAIKDKFLYQHVCDPTRYRPNVTLHILDLVLTNEENMVNNLQCLPGLGLSDHQIWFNPYSKKIIFWFMFCRFYKDASFVGRNWLAY